MTEESLQITNDGDGDVSPQQQEQQPEKLRFLNLTETDDGGWGRELEAEKVRVSDEQTKLKTEARAELAALAKLGFDKSTLPDRDIQPYEVELWRMQKLNAQHDFKALAPILLRYSTSSQKSWINEFLLDRDLSDEEKEELIASRLPRLYGQLKEQFEGTRPRTVAELKEKMEEEDRQKNEADQKLITGRSADDIEARISEIDHTPGMWADPRGGLRLEITDNRLYQKLKDEREQLFLELDAVLRGVNKRDNYSDYKPKFGRR